MNKFEIMNRVFEIAKYGIGKVSPNPLVGAVLIKNDKIIGEGYHQYYGGNHAEVEAIKNTKESTQNAILFCNLEPCVHTDKKTLPCVDLIIKSGIKKVIISNLDKNPKVNGKGLEKLKRHGIEVEVGILKEEGLDLNKAFFKYIQTKKPFIHLKFAQTLDGKIATINGDSRWISDEAARSYVHTLRHENDAVMVGRNTFNTDNPLLNIRMGKNRTNRIPYRVILGRFSKIKWENRLFNENDLSKVILVGPDNDKVPKNLLIKGLKVITINKKDTYLDDVFNKLGEFKISSILIEGGGNLISEIIQNDLYDKITGFVCPKLIGNGISFFKNNKVKFIKEAISFSNISFKSINNQIVFEVNKVKGR